MKPLTVNSMPNILDTVDEPLNEPMKPVNHGINDNKGLNEVLDGFGSFVEEYDDEIKETLCTATITAGAVGVAKTTGAPKLLKIMTKAVQIFFKFLRRYNNKREK